MVPAVAGDFGGIWTVAIAAGIGAGTWWGELPWGMSHCHNILAVVVIVTIWSRGLPPPHFIGF